MLIIYYDMILLGKGRLNMPIHNDVLTSQELVELLTQYLENLTHKRLEEHISRFGKALHVPASVGKISNQEYPHGNREHTQFCTRHPTDVPCHRQVIYDLRLRPLELQQCLRPC